MDFEVNPLHHLLRNLAAHDARIMRLHAQLSAAQVLQHCGVGSGPASANVRASADEEARRSGARALLQQHLVELIERVLERMRV